MNGTAIVDKRRRLHPVLRVLIGFFAFVGAVALVYIVVGLAADINAFDETTGGYEYPYAGWTGTPINYSEMYTTSEGMYSRGNIIELYVNCATGMMTWSVFGSAQTEFREFSDRAKVVHQPHIECRERGFDTSAWDTIDDPDGLFPRFAAPADAAS